MERYYPRAGLWCIVVAFPTWIVFLVNGMLGFFPAIIFADGGVGQKFHFWFFLKDRFFGGSVEPVWSDAGNITSQEWLLLALALPATLGALYCLRRRPDFGSIERSNEASQRESLEMGEINIGFTSGGDAHTQAIVESVIGEEQVVDQSVVSAALGEMGVIAAANATEEERAESESDSETILDSRFTTTIQDEEVLDMVSAYADESPQPIEEEDDDDDIGWGVWDPDMDLQTEPEPEPEPEVKLVTQIEPEIESKTTRDLPEIPQIFREPVHDTPDPLEVPTIPEIPSFQIPTPNLGERISSMATQAADTTVNVTRDVVIATVTGAKDVVSKAAEITEKVVEKVRQKSTKGVMPVRPPGLPPMAEWDAYQGAWTIMGRPIQVAESPEPDTPVPDWSRTENEPPTPTIQAQQEVVSSERRKTPFIPELP